MDMCYGDLEIWDMICKNVIVELRNKKDGDLGWPMKVKVKFIRCLGLRGQ